MVSSGAAPVRARPSRTIIWSALDVETLADANVVVDQLRHRTITRPNEVWAMDITYIPMAHGFVYLAAVLDWVSRRVLSWSGSITSDSAFCIAAVEEALAHYGRPAIFNTDQGALGGFNRSSQHRVVRQTLDVRLEPLPASSILTSCAACC